MSVRQVAVIGATTVLTGFAANWLYFNVLRAHNSFVISALVYSCPLFTLLLAAAFLNERITVAGVAGVLLICAGLFCIALNDKGESFQNMLIGVAAARE
jgi:drug/metabolite transporter (DMT)-like permease